MKQLSCYEKICLKRLRRVIAETNKMSKWLEINDNIPRNIEILFMTGDETIHIGMVFGEEKIRKCIFHSFKSYEERSYYDCDPSTPHQERVVYWHPLPEGTKDE
jgi:hypothetical protein